jgi:Tfp pilus assembly protein PilO
MEAWQKMLRDRLIKSSSSSKMIVSASVVLIVAIAAYNWLISPQTTYLHAANMHETMMLNAEQKTSTIKKQIQQSQTQLDTLQIQIAKIQDKFFTPDRAKEFFLDLEPISLQYNCNIESFEFKPEISSKNKNRKSTSAITAKSAQVVLSGTYPNIVKFIKKLSGFAERVCIDDISLEPVYLGSRRLNCNMTVTIYLIQDKEIIKDGQN